MTKYLKPIPLVYRCPRLGKLVEKNECHGCEFYFGYEWYEGYWCVVCGYEPSYKIQIKGGVMCEESETIQRG